VFVGGPDAGNQVNLETATWGPVDVDMFIVGSDPADPATFVRTRGQALVASTTRGTNRFEDISGFTAPTDGFYGVVLVNQSGTAGSCLLGRFG
jgi:hypothetical protein